MAFSKELEAVLFYKNEPVALKTLASLLGTDREGIREGLAELETALRDRGVCLIYKDDSVMLSTSGAVSDLIERVAREELSRELGKAALETLAIIVYRGPVTRADIDYIRGVNSTFIVRSLLIRGLVERVENPQDKRSFRYRPTFELLRHMGVTRLEDMPDYVAIREEIEQKKTAMEEQDETDHDMNEDTQ